MSSHSNRHRRYRNIDYGRWARAGFLVGLGLLLVGALGEVASHALMQSVPAWEETVFFYSEVAGVLTGFLSVWIFGVFLPLTE